MILKRDYGSAGIKGSRRWGAGIGTAHGMKHGGARWMYGVSENLTVSCHIRQKWWHGATRANSAQKISFQIQAAGTMKHWSPQRKTGHARGSGYPPARGKTRKLRRTRVSRKPVPLAWQDSERIIAVARSCYESMRRYEPERADAIAARLFNDLTSPFREHPTLLGRISGISDVTLWQWRIGRTSLTVDTVSKHCDRLVRGLGFPARLAEEAANLMSGIPWKGRKTGSQLLRYVVENGLDARSLLHLARRQERMNITAFSRKMGIPKDLLSSMSSPPEYDAKHPGKRGNRQVTAVA